MPPSEPDAPTVVQTAPSPAPRPRSAPPPEVPADWHPALAGLTADWRAVLDATAATRAASAADQVAAWSEAFVRLRARRAELVAAGEWHAHGPRDLLTIVDLGRREVIHTAVLAWLFRPLPEHGLGARLLDVLLAAAGAPPATPAEHAATRVTTEESRAGESGERRADIVVRLPGRTVLVEAKVDAEESPDQCRDLVRLWSDEPDVRFVFLTPSGVAPRTAGETVTLWHTLSFHTVRDALAALVETPAAARAPGAAAVRTYHHALEAHFPRSPAVEIDARVRFYLENKALLDEWARLATEAGALADQWFRRLGDPFKSLAAELGPDVHLHAELEGAWPKYLLARSAWGGGGTNTPPVGVGFEWNKGSAAFDRGYTGVRVHRPNPALAVPLYTRVCKAVDGLALPREEPRTAWWPVWGYVTPVGPTWWDDLPAFQVRVVDQLRARWHTLAPAIDAAVAEL